MQPSRSYKSIHCSVYLISFTYNFPEWSSSMVRLSSVQDSSNPGNPQCSGCWSFSQNGNWMVGPSSPHHAILHPSSSNPNAAAFTNRRKQKWIMNNLSFRCYSFFGFLEMDEGICFSWIWFLIETSMVVVMFDYNFYKTLTFWSFFLLFFYFYLFFNVLRGERHKREQKYIFSLIFNKGGWRNYNWDNVVKVPNFKFR